MSHHYNYQSDQFDDPPIHHQHRHNVQYGMRSQQHHVQHVYQHPKPQHYTYQPSHQNFQQHPPQQMYSRLAQPQSQPLYSQLAHSQQLYSHIAQPQHYAANQNPQQFPLPPASQPSIQPHQNQRDRQPQLQKPTDPRNARPDPVAAKNSNLPSGGSLFSKVVQNQGQTTKLEKKRKRNEKNKKRKQNKNEKKSASQCGTIVGVDSELAEFTQTFKVSEYKKFTSKFKIDIPLTDKYHGGEQQSNNANNGICIAFHCSGSCSPTCSKKESHRPLSASERKRFVDYLSKVKRRIEEERKEASKKKTKKSGSTHGDDEGLSGRIMDVSTPYDDDERFDKNPSIDLSLKEIVNSSTTLSEYRKCAKKFGVSTPQLDAYHGTDSRQGEICLVYHCKGNCSRHCSDKESHRQLTAAEQKRLYDYLSKVRSLEESGENSNPGEELDDEKETKPQQELSSNTMDDSDDGRFDDCPDDDDIQILGTVGGKEGTSVFTSPSHGNDDGTMANPVDLTDAVTPLTKELYSGLPARSSFGNTRIEHSVVVSSSTSLDFDLTSETTTARIPTAENTSTAVVPTTSSVGEIMGGDHQEFSTYVTYSSTAVQTKSPIARISEGHPGEVPKLLLPKSSNNTDSVNKSNKEATMTSADPLSDNHTKPPEQTRKEGLSPNSKTRKLKKLRVQLELAKKQRELAKLKEGLLKKDQELKQHKSQDSFRRPTLVPISALSASLIIENIHESGPEHTVYFPHLEVDYQVQAAKYKAILYGNNKEEDDAMETLSSRKTQIERDLAILKERLESSLSSAAASSISREDLQRKLEEAQANKDLSYWKLFVSKQDHILSSVDKQIKENAASLEQFTDEITEVERESRETVASINVLKVREATLDEMVAKSSIKILQMRQRLHEQQTQLSG